VEVGADEVVDSAVAEAEVVAEADEVVAAVVEVATPAVTRAICPAIVPTPALVAAEVTDLAAVVTTVGRPATIAVKADTSLANVVAVAAVVVVAVVVVVVEALAVAAIERATIAENLAILAEIAQSPAAAVEAEIIVATRVTKPDTCHVIAPKVITITKKKLPAANRLRSVEDKNCNREAESTFKITNAAFLKTIFYLLSY